MRVAYETMLAEFERVLNKYGFSPERAHEAAEIFAQNSLAGVFSHGLNRFPVVVDYLKKGGIDPAATAECIASFGAMERWNGKRGFGPLNARHAMGRAVELAVEKLTKKLEGLESQQATMKAVNAYFRKHKTLDGCPAFSSNPPGAFSARRRALPQKNCRPATASGVWI